MTRKPLDPALAAILDSIRATVGGETAAPLPAEAPADVLPPAPAPRAAGPLAAPSPSVEEFVADLLRPQLQAWLDAHLPEMVQAAVDAEVRRLTGGSGGGD